MSGGDSRGFVLTSNLGSEQTQNYSKYSSVKLGDRKHHGESLCTIHSAFAVAVSFHTTQVTTVHIHMAVAITFRKTHSETHLASSCTCSNAAFQASEPSHTVTPHCATPDRRTSIAAKLSTPSNPVTSAPSSRRSLSTSVAFGSAREPRNERSSMPEFGSRAVTMARAVSGDCRSSVPNRISAGMLRAGSRKTMRDWGDVMKIGRKQREDLLSEAEEGDHRDGGAEAGVAPVEGNQDAALQGFEDERFSNPRSVAVDM